MWPTSLTVPQRGTRRGNMAYSTLGMLLGLLCASAHDLTGIPRTSWERQEASLLEFSEPGISNYSTLLLREDRGVLYVGAKEAIFELHMRNISVKNNMVMWEVPERHMLTCTSKGKTKETDCLNYIRVVEEVSNDRLYVCGTHAFQPLCDYLSLKDFVLEGNQEDGRGKCPFDPAQSFASVMVDGELYSGTVNNFLGSEPIISKSSLSQSMLRTEYSTSWLNEPSFVLADIVRVSEGDEDDEVYYFFTEVSVEYEFFGKLLIPRIARVCKGDLGGLRTLQKKWTSFLKAKLVCSMPETNFVFNVVHDVFILKTANRGETLVYGVFSSQWGNVGSSAVCSYSMSAVDQVFSSGKYMQKASVEQLHTKWVRYNGVPPSPRPGACIDSQDRLQNISSSLNLPDKTLQFVKDHPLLEDPVLPVGNRPKFMTKDVRYTQIAVERVLALDNKQYDVIFTGTDKGVLHKSVVYEDGVHIIEEIQLLPDSESIKTLILSSHGLGFLYAASDSSVVQAPTARCGGYPSCQSCILARDPYCAWDPEGGGCARLPREQDIAPGNLLQSLNGDAEKCPQAGKTTSEGYRRVSVRLGHSAELPCRLGSSSARAVWKVNGGPLSETSPAHRQSKAGLLVHAVSPNHGGHYECWALERTGAKDSSWLVQGYVLSVDPADGLLTPDTSSTTGTRPTTIPPSESAATPTALDKAPAEHLRSEGNSAQLILLILVILLILLLLAGVSYNCYMLYLPDPCLRARAGLLGRPKQPQPEYAACEAGLMERATDKPSCANGARPKAPPDAAQEAGPEPEPGKSSAKDTDSPFDVVCDSQPIEFVDVDAPC